MANPSQAGHEHALIIQYLREGDYESAAKQLEDHWHSGIGTVSYWIDEYGQRLEVDKNDQIA